MRLGAGVRSIAVNATYLVGAQGVNTAVRAIYAIVLARYLGPESYGFFAYGLNWSLTFLPFAMLGLDDILSREIGRTKERAGKVVGSTLSLRLVATVAAAIGCIVAALALEPVRDVQILLYVFALALVGRSIATWSNAVFTAYEASSKTFQQESVFRSLEVPLGCAVLFAGGGVLGVVWVHAAIWWLQATRGLIMIHRHLTPLRAEWDPPLIAALVQSGVPQALANIFGGWVLYGPLVVFRYTVDDAIALGHLALVLQAFTLLAGVPFAFGRASLPVLSRAAHQNDGREQAFLALVFRVAIVLGAAIALVGMGAGPWVVGLLLGQGYIDAGALLGPALWLLIPATLSSAADYVLVARGRMVARAVGSLLGAVVMTVSVPLLVPRLGAGGILLAAGLGMAAWGGMSTWFVMRDVEVNLNRSVARPAIAAALALAGFLATSLIDPWLAMGVSIVILFSTAFALQTLTTSEQQALMTLIRGRLSLGRQ